MRKLILHLKGEYFDEIKAGRKPKEYRLVTPYWEKRLVGRTYDGIELARGYPKRGDVENRLTLPWLGYQSLNSTHKCNAHPCINFVRRLPAQAFSRA